MKTKAFQRKFLKGFPRYGFFEKTETAFGRDEGRSNRSVLFLCPATT